ncbi:lipase 3-like [Epargyreus clarus]|uniref:lipase 3-like n=1 Tax=Epargyreus clarus TaxID=520877 RepID=UPI003C2B0D87
MLWVYFIASIFISSLVGPNNGYTVNRNLPEEEPKEIFDTYQAILDEGYPAETHHVTTPDGYILEVIRIPHGRNQTRNNAPRPVVFMMHGLLAAASSFVIRGSEYSIAYHLVDAGFDIWMGNARGNHFSRFHITLDPDHPEEKFDFFDFTFEEIGMYDLPTMIDYVLEKTGREELHYIGHSQGGTAFLVLSTMRPDYNKKIKAAHLMAAVGYQDHMPNEQLISLARHVDAIYAIALLQGLVEYFPLDQLFEERRSINPDNCFGDTKYKDMCYLSGSRGLVSDETDASLLLAGASLKQIAHYGQNIRDIKFRRWHHGDAKNIEIYGTIDPPIYDLNQISTYVTMHYSLSDTLLDERDVIAMVNDIPKSKARKVERESFLHEDYVTSKDAKEMVTDFIIEDIWKIEAGNFDDWDKTPVIEEDKEEEDKEVEDNPGVTESPGEVPSAACGLSLTLVQVYLIACSFYVVLRK